MEELKKLKIEFERDKKECAKLKEKLEQSKNIYVQIKKKLDVSFDLEEQYKYQDAYTKIIKVIKNTNSQINSKKQNLERIKSEFNRLTKELEEKKVKKSDESFSHIKKDIEEKTKKVKKNVTENLNSIKSAIKRKLKI